MTCASSASRTSTTSAPALCGKPTRSAWRLSVLAIASATLGLAASPAQALTLFAGAYAPASWTQTVGGDGSINTSGAPTSVELFGANDNSDHENFTDFTIVAPAAGTVSFNWNYKTFDDKPRFDPFGYLLNGYYAILVDDNAGSTQSGSAAFPVSAGDVFGFRQSTGDSSLGRASTVISSFNGPTSAPPPSPVPVPLPLLGAGAAFGWSRRLRNRSRAPWLTPSQA